MRALSSWANGAKSEFLAFTEPGVVIDRAIFRWYRQKLQHKLNTAEAVDIHTIFPVRSYYGIVFARSEVRDAFNQGLGLLRKNGRHQALISRYLGESDAPASESPRSA